LHYGSIFGAATVPSELQSRVCIKDSTPNVLCRSLAIKRNDDVCIPRSFKLAYACMQAGVVIDSLPSSLSLAQHYFSATIDAIVVLITFCTPKPSYGDAYRA
jgi:hypothetical protein